MMEWLLAPVALIVGWYILKYALNVVMGFLDTVVWGTVWVVSLGVVMLGIGVMIFEPALGLCVSLIGIAGAWFAME